MKFIGVIFFVGLIYAASARVPLANRLGTQIIERYGINEQFVDFIERERENFRCGWPGLGIPIIEPMYIEHYELEMDALSTLSSFKFQMRDAYAHGAEDFDIEFFNFSVLRMLMNFEVTLPVMRIEGDHTTYAQMLQGAISVPISAFGKFTMVCTNIKVVGTVQLRTLLGGFLNIESMDVNVSIDKIDADLRGFGLINGLVNSIISAAAPGMVADNQEMINDEIREMVLPMANGILNEMTLTDLINVMAEGNMNPPPRRCYH